MDAVVEIIAGRRMIDGAKPAAGLWVEGSFDEGQNEYDGSNGHEEAELDGLLSVVGRGTAWNRLRVHTYILTWDKEEHVAVAGSER